MTQVTLLEHSHKHGTSVFVCATPERASAKIQELVRADWRDAFPTDAPAVITDDDIN